jgi:sporulation and spore germination protein
MDKRIAIIAALILAAFATVWLVVSRRSAQPATRPGTPGAAPTTDAASTAAAEPKIKATLYYVSEDGLSLPGVQREVLFGDPVVEQAKRIVEAELGDAPPPYASPIPRGTRLRALYMGDRGDAFVDLSGEVRTAHTGGALDEIFTTYAIVNALTVNLPAITRVQILVDGKEVDTLAGHVDLRRPLQKNLKWTSLHPDAETAEGR